MGLLDELYIHLHFKSLMKQSLFRCRSLRFIDYLGDYLERVKFIFSILIYYKFAESLSDLYDLNIPNLEWWFIKKFVL